MHTSASARMPVNREPDGKRWRGSPSDRRRGLSQNYDKDQKQDREDHRARTQEYDFAHYIGLQQVIATHEEHLPNGSKGRLARVTASCL